MQVYIPPREDMRGEWFYALVKYVFLPKGSGDQLAM
jgi:hypothetical protein